MKLLFFCLALLISTSILAKDLVLDTTTQLLWQDASINKNASVTYKEARNYCRHLQIHKHKNFRLPTLTELQSLVDYSNYKPAILDGFQYVENTTYWTTTPFVDEKDAVWTINFEKGSRSTKAIYYDRHFRCVKKIKK